LLTAAVWSGDPADIPGRTYYLKLRELAAKTDIEISQVLPKLDAQMQRADCSP
jgi:hypothetical protein